MATVTKAFSDEGVSSSLFVKKGDKLTYTVDLSNDFDGKLFLRASSDGGKSYFLNKEITADITAEPLDNDKENAAYDFVVEYGDGETSLTGTADIVLADVDTLLHEIKDRDGNAVLAVYESGIQVTGTVTASGSNEVGAVAEATSSVVEYGSEAVHKTVITLTSTPLEVVSVTTGNGVGGVKVYDFPAGYIHIHGCTANLSLAVETESDFTDGTPEGQLGIGTVAPANADALGTDATDDNIGTAADFTMTDYVDSSVSISPEASLNLNGTATPVDVYLNALVDSGDIDDDATTNLLVSGTITIVWSNLGDF